ncbi:siderophore-interacting protein [Xylanimonas oleitrophica]|uniref:Siderophore-interacting protein n=1 Tax=Xylanimonas oleitrophica TaxID=2607479 RepID=A0A2W5WUF1_9MICO|nr:siderophore-interacting protein [Xylanimonas oleitrophica]PZR55109.1 siderophore-interacting protein [Xylanimonas oleitrophica]
MTQDATTSAPPARTRVPHTVTVTATRRLTPHMVRVTVGGEALRGLDVPPFTDRYVKLVMAEPPVVDGVPQGRPLLRTYTVRAVREAEWDLDVLLHGDEGLGGPWAARARPGDPVTFLGPGGGYAPDPEAPWHLLVGDASALPAIAASIEAMPEDAVVHAFVEVDDEAEKQDLPGPAATRVTWVVKGGESLEDAVVRAHAAGTLPSGVPHAFIHGEAGCVRVLRRWARAELGVPPERLSASGYWRRGADDERWRAEKAQWREAVERDDAELAHA